MKKASKLAILLLCLAGTSISFGQGPFQQSQPSAADKIRLTKLERAYKAAKAALAKSPHSPKAKRDFVSVGTAYGHESMVTGVLDRKVKYRQALHIYGEVLKIDPAEPTARKESDLIIGIYKQMGRPIPKD